ncbi:resistance protein [Trifolium medium]|uniref:Resistance protein n=1 Tax=Trifolium medium TaxID=97028 RepID=A0A392NAS5_9FABA|nr:resistance protein [Trifolium medium]
MEMQQQFQQQMQQQQQQMHEQQQQLQQMQDQHQQYLKNSLARVKNLANLLEGVWKVLKKSEEERMFEGCGVAKIMKEIETPHEVGLSQVLPSIEKDDTVDNEEVTMVAEENEGLLDKEESCEQKKEMENKAEIDQVINEICVLFNKKELGRI